MVGLSTVGIKVISVCTRYGRTVHCWNQGYKCMYVHGMVGLSTVGIKVISVCTYTVW